MFVFGEKRFSAPLRVDDVAPVEIAAAQTLHEHLRRGGVGRKGDLVLVAQALDLVDVVKAVGVGRVAEKEDQVDLVEGDARADLLRAALVGVQLERDRQARGLADELSRDMRGAQGVFGQDAAVRDAELHHQLLFSVMCHQSNIHTQAPFPVGSGSDILT